MAHCAWRMAQAGTQVFRLASTFLSAPCVENDSYIQ
jgi:hypothetical protein